MPRLGGVAEISHHALQDRHKSRLGAGPRRLWRASTPPGAAVGGPGAARAGVDVENAKAVVLEATHRLLAQQELADSLDVAGDAEIHGAPGQMIGVRCPANAGVVRLAPARGI